MLKVIYCPNPMLDSREYAVIFPAQRHTEAEAMNPCCNPNGHQILLINEIIDHTKMHKVVLKDNTDSGEITSNQSWNLCISWKDGTTSWHSLVELKESFPVKAAHYAVNNKLVSEPVFN